MEYIQGRDRAIPLDHNGFILNFKDWDDQFTRYYAANKNLSLGEEHWVIIHYIRKYFSLMGVAPMVKLIQRELGISPQKIGQLFNLTDIKDVCKLAGLPCSIGFI